jgi:hypothetical protein
VDRGWLDYRHWILDILGSHWVLNTGYPRLPCGCGLGAGRTCWLLVVADADVDISIHGTSHITHHTITHDHDHAHMEHGGWRLWVVPEVVARSGRLGGLRMLGPNPTKALGPHGRDRAQAQGKIGPQKVCCVLLLLSGEGR